MATMRAVEAQGRAKALVDRLRADWLTGLDWGPVIIEEIALVSPPDAWPPVIRLDFRVDDRHVRWEDPWEGEVLRASSLEAASNLWLGIVFAHLCEQGYL